MKLKVLSSSSKGNCYLLKSDNETLIIEAGINTSEIKKALNYDLYDVVGCLLTHEHGDHAKGVKKLSESFIDIYSSSGTLNAIGIKGNVMSEMKKYTIGKFVVMPIKAFHDASQPFCYVIKHPDMGTLAFCTDTARFDYKITNLNHLLIEANYSEEIILKNNLISPNSYNDLKRLRNSHLGIEDCKTIIKRHNSLTNIILLHLSDRNSDKKQFKKECQEVSGIPVRIAQKGLEITL